MELKTCLGAAAVLLFLSSCGHKNANTQAGPPPQAYPTEVMEPRTVPLQAVYPVTIKGRDDVEIRPRIDGFIEQIYFDEGSVIRKGQSLYKINSPQAEQGVVTARAAVNSARAGLNTAKLNVERMRPLAEKNIISHVQLMTYENQYESAQAALSQAEASLAQAEASLSWTYVYSPVDGLAGPLNYRQGSLVNSANVLTVVANTSNAFAYFSINEKELMDMLSLYDGATQAEKIRQMPPVTLTLADGTQYPDSGRIETISGVVNTPTGSANFRAEFPNAQGKLRSGTSGKIALPRLVHDAFLIPQKATFAQQNKVLIYVVEADTVRQQVITVLPTPDGQSYAVTGGLSRGERIVTDGVATLAQGKRIKVEP